jgi:hypothetical protein
MKALCGSPLLIILLVGSLAARSAKIRLAHSVNLKLLLVIGLLIGWQLPAIAQTGFWTSNQYYDHTYGAWWVQVSSTVPRAFALTVSWHGYRGYGLGVKGSFVLLVPAYPGFGAPVTAQKGVPGIHNFGYTIAPAGYSPWNTGWQ